MQPIVAGDSMRQGGRAEITPEHIASVVRSQVGDRTFRHWFEGRTQFSVDRDVVRIAVASPFLMTWMQKQLREPLYEAAVGLLGPAGRFELHVDAAIAPAPTAEAKAQTNLPASDAAETGAPAILRHRRFASLDEFVSGESNQLALVAAQQISANPGQKYNPLFVHGPAGTGKTHLLEGIYREVRR